jgi:hypothetical protein
MQGHQVKRGVVTTLERVFKASGQEIANLNVMFSGNTAGIIFERNSSKTLRDVKLIFPSIDDSAEIPLQTFNDFIAFALHELGHAWFTTNEPWDRARATHGEYLGALINGLEDPRIEQCVINSHYAENSRVLFEQLINSMLTKYGYADPDDLQNVPFVLAVEARRLNGYAVNVPSILDASPWSVDLKWALKKVASAKDTKAVVLIAIDLFERLKKKNPTSSPQPTKPQPDGQPDGNPDGGKGDKADKGDKGEKGDQGGQQGDADDGADGSEQGNKPSNGDGQGQGSQADDKPSDEKPSNNGGGHSILDQDIYHGKRIEPDKLIESECKTHSATVDANTPRPAVRKAKIVEITFYD